MEIKIEWTLGTETGTRICLTDSEATKFSAELYARKLALIDVKPTEVKSFENKIYNMARKDRKITRRSNQYDSFKSEYEILKNKIGVLQNNTLSVSISKI